MLCPELIGRDREVERLRGRVEDLAQGRGGVVALVGEAGAGKSRLARTIVDEAATGGALVLFGRAVPGESSTPYRPLAEAALAALRGRDLPSDPALGGFERHLSLLVPGFAAEGPADHSPVLLGEAVVRLLAVLAGGRPAVLFLDDLHWADPETVQVVEYLGDALRSEPVLCVCTARPEGGAHEVLDRIARRDPTALLRVGTLEAAGVEAMVAACLRAPDPPAALADFVLAHSDGSPFLVEELLAGLDAAGALQRTSTGWEVTGPLTPAVPASLRESIGRRLAGLDPTARRILCAASLLGRSFEWELLPGIAGVDGATAVDALRRAVDEQLIEADGERFRFRHALTREAVLEHMLLPERRELAERARPVWERSKPGLPGSACQLAAELAEAAGDRVAAVGLHLESARRALASGALATAEAAVRRARDVAGEDPGTRLDADELLVQVLAETGKSGEALELGRDLAERLAAAGASPERRADLYVVLARAATAAGDLDAAVQAVQSARAVAGAGGGPELLARIDVTAAAAALDRADYPSAEALCRSAVEQASATGQADVECEALLLLGRLYRPTDSRKAHELFETAARTASDAGLDRWQLRAQQELALDTFATSGGARLVETRQLAVRHGALVTVAVMDLTLADLALSDFDGAACVQSASACVEASRRYRLATESVASLWLAGGHALLGDDTAMEEAVRAALARDADDPRILGDLYGRVLLTRAFVRDELDTLPGLLAQMMVHVRRAPPTESVFPGRILYALLETADGPDCGAQARAEYQEATAGFDINSFRLAGEAIEAVALGRAGDRDTAAARFETIHDAMVSRPIMQGLTRCWILLVARAAIRDGWGEPARWLRECEAWFAARGFDRLVRRSRLMLRDAGAPMPRKGRGESEVPASLRALGVTSREMDVLRLVVAGRSTKEIAAELFLSPKTVERHLTSLFARTGTPNRRALAEMGVAHLS